MKQRSCKAPAGAPAYLDTSLPFEKRAADLVSRLTLEEKASQMLHGAPPIPRLGIPRYNWWNEALHGVARAGLATVFPQAIGRAATFDAALERRVGTAISDEARAKFNLFQARGNASIYTGLTFWSPNINMFRDPRWGRGQETFGEDPLLSGQMGSAFVRGLQGDDPKYLKAAACAKHFAVHSGPEKERHGFDAIVSEEDMRNYYLPAFETLVKDAKVEAVMSAYNSVNGEPCSASPTLLDKILRKEWKFAGHVVSDCGAIGDILNGHKTVSSPKEAAAAAVQAGCDLCCGQFYSHLVEAVRTGLIPESELDVHLVRLFTTRMRLGLFDPKGSTPWDGLGEETVASDAHHALALRCAEESLVLVANNGVLPLDRAKVKKLGVCGPLALDEHVLLGNYFGLPGRCESAMAGLTKVAGGGVQIVYGRAYGITDADPVPAWAYGQIGDLGSGDGESAPIVAFVGLAPILEGEEGETIPPYCGDRTTLSLPESQRNVLKNLRERGHKIIAVVFGGSPLDLAWAREECDAVLVAWYPGQAGGLAIARTIFGLNNPAGRLPVTYPKSLESLPPFRDYACAGRTYRYSAEEPLFPFGYGLSYTTFRYAALKIAARPKGKPNAPFKFTVDVRNTGKRAGDEVVQVYLEAPASAPNAPRVRLVAFKRVSLRAGESKTVSFSVRPRDLATWNRSSGWAVAPGTYRLSAGGGQPRYAKCASALLRIPRGK